MQDVFTRSEDNHKQLRPTCRSLVHLMLVLIVLGVMSGCSGGGGSNNDGNPLTRVEALRADIDFLAGQMQAIHPNLFHALPQEVFARAVDDLKSTLETYDGDGFPTDFPEDALSH